MIDLLCPPNGKGGCGTDFARQPGTLHQDIEIKRFGKVIWIAQSRGQWVAGSKFHVAAAARSYQARREDISQWGKRAYTRQDEWQRKAHYQ
jgi:hypothetical protein